MIRCNLPLRFLEGELVWITHHQVQKSPFIAMLPPFF